MSLPRPRPPRPRKPPNCAPPGAGVVPPDCVGLHPTGWSEPRPRSAGRRGSNRSCSTGCDAAGSLITARPATGASVCLGCRLPSERVDGRYRRHVLDLPVAGRPVRLLAIARRFHCDTCCAGDRFPPVAIGGALVRRGRAVRSGPIRWASGDADGDGLGGADHAIEHLEREGSLGPLAGQATGAQLGADQALVSADGGFAEGSSAAPRRLLPGHPALLRHEQFATRQRAFGIWWRRAAWCLNGMPPE